MSEYRVTFKRAEEFYQAVVVKAATADEAREKAEQLSSEETVNKIV